jgi:hypothetical protein
MRDSTMPMINIWNKEALRVIILVLSVTFVCFGQSVQPENIPDEIEMQLQTGPFEKSYSLSGRINPFYLRGDFDGDGKPDYAFAITSKTDQARGIAIWLSSQKKILVLGAGNPFRYGVVTKDLAFDVWQVYGKRPVEQGATAEVAPKLIGEAILVGKSESASGLIYWNGKSFAWYQQGD